MLRTSGRRAPSAGCPGTGQDGRHANAEETSCDASSSPQPSPGSRPGDGGGRANESVAAPVKGATTTLTDSTVSGNTATGRGGGIHHGPRGTLTTTSFVKGGNTAARGGGIAAVDATATTLTSAHKALRTAGGIYRRNGTMTLTTSPVGGTAPPQPRRRFPRRTRPRRLTDRARRASPGALLSRGGWYDPRHRWRRVRRPRWSWRWCRCHRACPGTPGWPRRRLRRCRPCGRR